jgi:hypothetical protein
MSVAVNIIAKSKNPGDSAVPSVDPVEAASDVLILWPGVSVTPARAPIAPMLMIVASNMAAVTFFNPFIVPSSDSEV